MTCTWEPDFPEALTDAWDAVSPADQQRALMLATSSLQMLTYYRVGTCPITIRPCPQVLSCACGHWLPTVWDGQWYNCSNCNARCKPLSEIDIPGPVGYIDSVKVDGQELDLDSPNFRVDDGHLLVWQGTGPSPFPETQDLNKPDTAIGTWSITYSKSYPVNAEGRLAVAYLALEFSTAFRPKGKCSLPKGVTNVVRNGVSFSVEAGLFPGGLTGNQVVDAFILKWAPAGAPTKPAFVFDPAKRGPRRVSGVPRRPATPAPVIDGGQF